jgi:type VI secretion system protein ImpF
VGHSQLNYFFGPDCVKMPACAAGMEDAMEGFTPGFFDRVLGTSARGGGNAGVARMTAEEYKDAVARDLEALLNTRSVYPENALAAYPECSKSLVTYGLTDFADRSLSSPSDRAYICDCLEKTIERHEPRLRKVKAMLEVRDDMSVNRLRFSITALLVVSASEEPVNFDALLQPSTLQYSISKAGRGPGAASAGG